MTDSYTTLLKEHIIHALTNSKTVSLKEFTQQLIQKNSGAREEIIEAYRQINEELVGTLDV